MRFGEGATTKLVTAVPSKACLYSIYSAKSFSNSPFAHEQETCLCKFPFAPDNLETLLPNIYMVLLKKD